jgi:hypothetical protein
MHLLIAIIAPVHRCDTWQRETKRLSLQRSLRSARKPRFPKRILWRVLWARNIRGAREHKSREQRKILQNFANTTSLCGYKIQTFEQKLKFCEDPKSLSVSTFVRGQIYFYLRLIVDSRFILNTMSFWLHLEFILMGNDKVDYSLRPHL